MSPKLKDGGGMMSTSVIAPLLMSRSNCFILSSVSSQFVSDGGVGVGLVQSNGNICSRNRLAKELEPVEKTKSGIPGCVSIL